MRRMPPQTEAENVIFGIRPITEAIHGGKELDKVLFRTGIQGEGFRDLFELIRKKKIPYQYVPENRLNQITRSNHQGVVAYITLITYRDLNEIIRELEKQKRLPFLLMLDHITDVRNFGAIARTAECAGIDAIIIPDKGAARINAEAIKTSSGALMRVPVCRVPNLIKCGTTLLQEGTELFSVTEKGNVRYDSQTYSGAVCLIMGSEEDGISPALLKMSNRHILIPQYGSIGSLNVSVATGIVLFEAAKKRSATTG
jgi:23S rRNA (guanosine2251-2'-O)-methyltransferase